MAILKVAADSRPLAVAGAIAGVIRERGRVDVRAIGASAVNQAVKAVAIARVYLMPEGIDIVCIPSFSEVVIDGQKRTAICLEIVTNHK
ncbi:MAG: stage V sporulation protein S [Chloroflexi bacterium]|nr:stage V sporulation protein S [Chloroflexota bacterium]